MVQGMSKGALQAIRLGPGHSCHTQPDGSGRWHQQAPAVSGIKTPSAVRSRASATEA